MAVRPYLRSGGGLNIIARRANELWYRQRLKLIAADAEQALVPALKRYIDRLSATNRSSYVTADVTNVEVTERAMLARDLAGILADARKRFQFPISPERTATLAAEKNLASTDQWWVGQMRAYVEVSASALPQPRLGDAASLLTDAAPRRQAQPLPRRRVRVGVRPGAVQPLSTLEIIRGQEKITQAFAESVRWNVELIQSIPEQYFDRMEEVLFEHVQTAERWETMMDRLRAAIPDVNNLKDYRVELIARDQTSKMTAAFNRARSEAVGVVSYIWQTAGDDRVRPEHEANDGGHFWYAEPPPDTGNPGDDVNCRCAALPYVEEAYESEEGAA